MFVMDKLQPSERKFSHYFQIAVHECEWPRKKTFSTSDWSSLVRKIWSKPVLPSLLEVSTSWLVESLHPFLLGKKGMMKTKTIKKTATTIQVAFLLPWASKTDN